MKTEMVYNICAPLPLVLCPNYQILCLAVLIFAGVTLDSRWSGLLVYNRGDRLRMSEVQHSLAP